MLDSGGLWVKTLRNTDLNNPIIYLPSRFWLYFPSGHWCFLFLVCFHQPSDANLTDALCDSELGSVVHVGEGPRILSRHGCRVDADAAKRLAKRLFFLEGFKRCEWHDTGQEWAVCVWTSVLYCKTVFIHTHNPLFLVSFCCSNEFQPVVASEYLSFFDFTGSSLDRALRWEHFNRKIQPRLLVSWTVQILILTESKWEMLQQHHSQTEHIWYVMCKISMWAGSEM